jgi:hypothetical protein
MLYMIILSISICLLSYISHSQSYLVGGFGGAYGFSSPSLADIVDNAENSGATTFSMNIGIGKLYDSNFFLESIFAYSTWVSQAVLPAETTLTSRYRSVGLSLLAGYHLPSASSKLKPFLPLGLSHRRW